MRKKVFFNLTSISLIILFFLMFFLASCKVRINDGNLFFFTSNPKLQKEANERAKIEYFIDIYGKKIKEASIYYAPEFTYLDEGEYKDVNYSFSDCLSVLEFEEISDTDISEDDSSMIVYYLFDDETILELYLYQSLQIIQTRYRFNDRLDFYESSRYYSISYEAGKELDSIFSNIRDEK